MRIAAMLLLCLALTGCVFVSGTLTGGGPQYTGEPTELVVQIQRAGAANAMRLMAEEPDETHQVIVRVQKGDIYRAHHTVSIPADQTEIAIQLELPSSTGYVISAVAHDGRGTILEEGHEAEIAVAANAGNVVVLELGPPEYEATIPPVLYSGGAVRQFRVTVPTASMLQSERILLGLQPWSTWGEWSRIPRDQRWVSESASYFPQVTEPTPVYYQIELCASDLPESANICYYEPAMGDPLPYVMIQPGPPPS